VERFNCRKLNDVEFWLENLKGRTNLEDLGITGRILEWILRNRMGTAWAAFICLMIWISGGIL
jgi:hypothetical protein